MLASDTIVRTTSIAKDQILVLERVVTWPLIWAQSFMRKAQMLHMPKARVTYTSTGRILSIFMVPTASNRRKKKKIEPRKTRIIWVFVILTCNIVTLRLWMRRYGMRGRVECATHWCRHSVHDQPESKKLKCKLHFFSTVEHFTSCHLLILQNNTLLKPKFNGFSVTETIVALFMFYWGKKRW